MQTQYCGVNLQPYQCHKLVPDQVYSQYKKNELHFPIGAMQKGLKPHTKIGIKRILRRNLKIKMQQRFIRRSNTKQADVNSRIVKKLNPKSPEEICMKALRKQFKQKLQTSHMEAQVSKTKKVSKTQSRRKQKQKARRKQLNKLVAKYRTQIIQIFGHQRMVGYGKCPKISRQQIWKALNIRPQQIQQKILIRKKIVSRKIQLDHSSFPIKKDVILPTTNRSAYKLPNLQSFSDFPTLK